MKSKIATKAILKNQTFFAIFVATSIHHAAVIFQKINSLFVFFNFALCFLIFPFSILLLRLWPQHWRRS
jgi:hypothetical protein